jgi:hypothetical protein
MQRFDNAHAHAHAHARTRTLLTHQTQPIESSQQSLYNCVVINEPNHFERFSDGRRPFMSDALECLWNRMRTCGSCFVHSPSPWNDASPNLCQNESDASGAPCEYCLSSHCPSSPCSKLSDMHPSPSPSPSPSPFLCPFLFPCSCVSGVRCVHYSERDVHHDATNCEYIAESTMDATGGI